MKIIRNLIILLAVLIAGQWARKVVFGSMTTLEYFSYLGREVKGYQDFIAYQISRIHGPNFQKSGYLWTEGSGSTKGHYN